MAHTFSSGIFIYRFFRDVSWLAGAFLRACACVMQSFDGSHDYAQAQIVHQKTPIELFRAISFTLFFRLEAAGFALVRTFQPFSIKIWFVL